MSPVGMFFPSLKYDVCCTGASWQHFGSIQPETYPVVNVEHNKLPACSLLLPLGEPLLCLH